MTDERVLYRCRKTVLEMLKDRGYEVGSAEIEETYDDFISRKLNMDRLTIIVHRPLPGRLNHAIQDEEGNPAQMQEPILVLFLSEEKIGAEIFNTLLSYMGKWSEENKDLRNTELLNAILVIKGASSQIFKKVSLSRPNRLLSLTKELQILTHFLTFV